MTEKRKSARSDMKFPISVWVSTFSKFWNGYSINISKGGALIHIDKFCS